MLTNAAVDREILAGRKIMAVAAYRDATGASLTDAERVVEAREVELRESRSPGAVLPKLFRLNLWVTLGFAVFVAVVLAIVMVMFFKVGSVLG